MYSQSAYVYNNKDIVTKPTYHTTPAWSKQNAQVSSVTKPIVECVPSTKYNIYNITMTFTCDDNGVDL